ncbi:MAG TPA: glycosyltransferase family 2 protein [Chitinophagaceae bacterium]|nr:glycosyltransferase family 2 protein [Chitinophagaceae bacterium]
MEKISVVIITYNEEKNIGRCIDSVRPVADEVVVLDSFSSDDTVAIAKSKGARVYQQPFAGYVSQKNKVLEMASCDYVLSLDADEELSDELCQSILNLKSRRFVFHAYVMNRRNKYCGRFIRHGTWYPDRKIRLFEKNTLRWGGPDVHEKIILPPRMAVYPLKGDLLHYTFESVSDHKKNNDKYSTIAARSLYKSGKRISPLKIAASPAWAFINSFILRLGFLDGYRGLVIACQQARYHYYKYAKLYKLQKGGMVVPIKPRLNIQPPAHADSLTRDIPAEV